ncbi:hypothetical protein BZL30_3348 [Mycobacterium kansasii]|uniref:MrfA-like Zn-binding domain-containing protein n=1 Tax=Mycobacterium kansasii TaxID=1768 RepID=A0A1V3X9E6_MYCKA|nr:hypothetical protein BZL30_3348 [Mycobacterium kansasii]
MAMVLRRLLRLCARYSAEPGCGPTVIFASATTDSPGATAAELIGQPVAEVVDDGSPQGARTVALWEPALRTDLTGENGAPVRRSAGAEAARVMADLIAEGAQTLTFVRSRRAAELTALGARARLDDVAPELSGLVASYRAGYLAEDRTALEHALAEGRLRGWPPPTHWSWVSTSPGWTRWCWPASRDRRVVLAAGRPVRTARSGCAGGTGRPRRSVGYLSGSPPGRAAGQAGRAGGDRPGQPLSSGSAIALRRSRIAARPGRGPVDGRRGGGARTGRRRAAAPAGDKYFPAPGVEPHAAVDIRGSIGGQIVIVESDTGRLLGSVDTGRAPTCVHPGAVYLHQGESYVVDSLDFEEGIAFVHAEDPGYATFAREITDITVSGPGERSVFGAVTLGLVPVTVTHQVIGYLRRLLNGEVIDFVELDMPEQVLPTTAVMYTITPDALASNGIDTPRIPGSLHAAEHAAIGLLPLMASCDRGDIGGISSAIGPEGLPSVFVYDGYPGGAGFAERGFRRARTWLGATAAAIEACECPSGCPSCVQSPKCGNGNDPLDKAGAVRVLRLVLAELVAEGR